MSKEGNYPVGYRRPPVEHQFKKNKSGNLKGRRPKDPLDKLEKKLRKALEKVLSQRVAMKDAQGDVVTMDIIEAYAFNAVRLGTKSGDFKPLMTAMALLKDLAPMEEKLLKIEIVGGTGLLKNSDSGGCHQEKSEKFPDVRF